MNITEKIMALEGVKLKHKLRLERKEEIRRRIDNIQAKREKLRKAVGLLDQVISRVSEGGIKKIEEIVTNGLKLSFPDQDLKFVVEVKSGVKGNSYRFLIQNGEVKGPATDTVGGGVVNVTQFLLRLLMIQRFQLAKVMFLDETFANVSDSYIENVSQLLRTLCEEESFKIFLVSHQPKLSVAAHNAYVVSPGPELMPVNPLEIL